MAPAFRRPALGAALAWTTTPCNAISGNDGGAPQLDRLLHGRLDQILHDPGEHLRDQTA